jgi:cytidyltransferase-like protein
VSRTAGPLVVVGDALLDRDLDGVAARLCPDAPVPVLEDVLETLRPGGAGLAALLAAQDGRDMVLVTALARDDAGDRLRELLADRVRLVDLGLDGSTPEKVRVRAAGQSVVRLDLGGAPGRPGRPDGAVDRLLARAGAVLVADYGRGVADVARPLLAARAGAVPIVWDPHPRGGAPVAGVRLATPNVAEAERFAGDDVGGNLVPGLARTGALAARLVERWGAGAVAVTMGERGALLSYGPGAPLVVPAPPVGSRDTCGAGDRFAATAAGAVLDGALPSEAVAAAVASASAFVRAGAAAAIFAGARSATTPPRGTSGAPDGSPRTASSVVAATRAAGGTVVATGGCFDLLHAGHVDLLRSARQLGDCLVVCLNSDASVRRIKGTGGGAAGTTGGGRGGMVGGGRPLVRQEDRARVLAALSSVDAVVIFEEDTPDAVLGELRPDIWAKGGDYAGTDLPEAATLAAWGGQAVLLPYLDGRSTSRLVEAARMGVPPHETATT